MRTKINLSDNSWVELDNLPQDLLDYTKNNFEQLFACHPAKKGKVIVKNKEICEINSPRYHKCYGKTPSFDPNLKYSYMFTGFDNQEQRNDPLPTLFQPYLDYINQNNANSYNQIVINWYSDGKDYIAKHADCYVGMIDDYNIASITLGSNNYKDNREMLFYRKGHGIKENVNSYKLINGLILYMCGDTQKEYRHSIPPNSNLDLEGDPRRIGLTFRQFKE